jgi:hypothetical protein
MIFTFLTSYNYFFYDICLINSFKKYLFGLIVVSYLTTTIGIPVYLHYCGGELEKVNFLVKATSCCGSEEEGEEDSGCCKDEGRYVQNNSDFTLKITQFEFANYSCNITFLVPLRFELSTLLSDCKSISFTKSRTLPLLSHLLVSTSVFRI